MIRPLILFSLLFTINSALAQGKKRNICGEYETMIGTTNKQMVFLLRYDSTYKLLISADHGPIQFSETGKWTLKNDSICLDTKNGFFTNSKLRMYAFGQDGHQWLYYTINKRIVDKLFPNANDSSMYCDGCPWRACELYGTLWEYEYYSNNIFGCYRNPEGFNQTNESEIILCIYYDSTFTLDVISKNKAELVLSDSGKWAFKESYFLLKGKKEFFIQNKIKLVVSSGNVLKYKLKQAYEELFRGNKERNTITSWQMDECSIRDERTNLLKYFLGSKEK